MSHDREPEPGPHDAPRPSVSLGGPHVAIITGLSGGGKTAAAKLFEDLGYIVIDNLPGELLPDLAELVVRDPTRFALTVAIVLDVRAGDASLAFAAVRGALEAGGSGRRCSSSRRATRSSSGGSPRRGIATRSTTARASPAPSPGAGAARRRPPGGRRRHRHQRSCRCGSSARSCSPTSATCPRKGGIAIQLISFGYKHGIPLEADLVFDVRFMQNPYYLARAAPAFRAHRACPRLRAGPAHRPGLPRPPRAASWTCSCRRTSARARPGSRSGSAARAASTARSCCRRRSRRGCAERDFGPVSVFHRELEPA